MNIDFGAHPGFSAYVLLLIFSGVVMVGVGSPLVGRQRPLYRFLNVLFGLGFLGYGLYLAFVFDGGHYVIFFKAFILPVLLIARSIRARTPRSSQPPVPQQWAQPPAPGQWAPPAAPAYPPAATDQQR